MNHSPRPFERLTPSAERFNADPAGLAGFIQSSNAAARPPAPSSDAPYDLPDIVNLLQRLSPARADNYTEWIKVGMLLHNISPDLLYLWEWWSRRSNSYEPDVCRAKWATFRDNGGDKLGLPSLRYWVNEDSPTLQPEVDDDFGFIDSAALDSNDFHVRYLIENVLAEKQAAMVGGPLKGMKTSLLVEMAVALAAGGLFLNKYPAIKSRVAIMSGESGMGALQSIARRIAASKDVDLKELPIMWTPQLPKMGNEANLLRLRATLLKFQIEVLLVDPAYLAMPGAKVENMFSQGDLLGSLNTMCLELGITLVIAHHVTRAAGKGKKVLDLHDLAWAGFGEFARQWIMITRREAYVDGTGDHKLTLKIGGSMGHSLQLNVDIHEGVYPNRVWELRVQDSVTAHREAERSKLEDDVAAIVETLDGSDGMTLGAIRETTGLGRGDRWKDAWAAASGRIEGVPVMSSNRRVQGFKLKTDSLGDNAIE